MSVNFNDTRAQELYKNFDYEAVKNTQHKTSQSLKTLENDTIELSNKVDKYSADDGKISPKDKLTNFAKGMISPITAMFKSPKNLLIGALSTAAIGALTVATGGALAPVLVTVGLVGGAVQFGKSAYKASTASTDDEARAAWRGLGTGTSAIVGSVAGAKAAAKGAKIANVENMNPVQATIACVKNTPKAIGKSFKSFTSGEFLINLGIKKQAQNTTKQEEVKETKQKETPKTETTEAQKEETKPQSESLKDKELKQQESQKEAKSNEAPESEIKGATKEEVKPKEAQTENNSVADKSQNKEVNKAKPEEAPKIEAQKEAKQNEPNIQEAQETEPIEKAPEEPMKKEPKAEVKEEVKAPSKEQQQELQEKTTVEVKNIAEEPKQETSVKSQEKVTNQESKENEVKVETQEQAKETSANNAKTKTKAPIKEPKPNDLDKKITPDKKIETRRGIKLVEKQLTDEEYENILEARAFLDEGGKCSGVKTPGVGDECIKMSTENLKARLEKSGLTIEDFDEHVLALMKSAKDENGLSYYDRMFSNCSVDDSVVFTDRLYHCTSQEAKTSIMQDGFDLSFCESSGNHGNPNYNGDAVYFGTKSDTRWGKGIIEAQLKQNTKLLDLKKLKQLNGTDIYDLAEEYSKYICRTEDAAHRDRSVLGELQAIPSVIARYFQKFGFDGCICADVDGGVISIWNTDSIEILNK